MTDERRRASRTPVDGNVVVRVAFKNTKQLKSCYVKDISKNGIFLKTPTPRETFEEVTVVLALPDGKELDLHGTVVHVIPGQGMGIQFSDLTPEKRAQLEAEIARYQTAPPIASPARSVPSLALEDVVALLRRILWIACDPKAVADADYYQLLGVAPDADATLVKERAAVLRVLLDPGTLPDGLEAHDPARVAALALAILDIEATLTDPARRREYDATRHGILR